MNTQLICLCGSGFNYQECCEPFHSGEKKPTTAVALMRSRYTAYVLRNAVYLQETWDATRRPKLIDFSKEKIDWLRLEIIDIKKITKEGIMNDKDVCNFNKLILKTLEKYITKYIPR